MTTHSHVPPAKDLKGAEVELYTCLHLAKIVFVSSPDLLITLDPFAIHTVYSSDFGSSSAMSNVWLHLAGPPARLQLR